MSPNICLMNHVVRRLSLMICHAKTLPGRVGRRPGLGSSAIGIPCPRIRPHPGDSERPVARARAVRSLRGLDGREVGSGRRRYCSAETFGERLPTFLCTSCTRCSDSRQRRWPAKSLPPASRWTVSRARSCLTRETPKEGMAVPQADGGSRIVSSPVSLRERFPMNKPSGSPAHPVNWRRFWEPRQILCI